MKEQTYKEQTLAKDSIVVHRIHIIIDSNIIPQCYKKENGRLKEEILSIKQSP
jgi:hypothetical protein